jgi:hypothetical protein
MKKILIGLILIGLMVIGCSQSTLRSQNDNNKLDAKELIQQLGADDWARRESAQNELTQVGEKLISEYRLMKEKKQETELRTLYSELKTLADALQAGCKMDDPEIRLRVEHIRTRLYGLTYSKIAFESYRDGNYEIYVMESDGTNQKNLTRNQARDDSPAWSPDGKKIAFGSTRDGNYEIYVMEADGTNQTRLTRNQVYDGLPTWNPVFLEVVNKLFSAQGPAK